MPRLLLCLFAGLLFIAHGLAQAGGLPSLEKLAKDRVDISALVVDLGNGKILASHRPDTALIPASVSKLVIAAAALERFGPDHRFVTKLMLEGKREGNRLIGDLVLVGGGDPGLTTRDLWELVMRLRQSGIHRIDGKLIIDESRFGQVPCHSKDRCDALKASSNGYDAPLSAAGINHGSVEIRVTAGDKHGALAGMALMPPSLAAEIPLHGSIKTTSRKRRPVYGVRRSTSQGRDTLHAYGEVPVNGGPYHIYRAITQPARHTGLVLSALLREVGIDLRGAMEVRSTPADRSQQKLADLHSDELLVLLRDMMRYSNNYIADVLTLQLADRDEARPLTLPAASKQLEAFIETAHHKAPAWLKPPNQSRETRLLSGSGLTVDSRLSARDLVASLTRMYSQHASFPAFVGGLSVPGHSSSRMLRRAGNRDWMTRLAVKTGYLSEPVTVLSLSGYIRLKEGGWAAFAVLTNGTKKRRSVSSSISMQAIRQDLEAMMARH